MNHEGGAAIEVLLEHDQGYNEAIDRVKESIDITKVQK